MLEAITIAIWLSPLVAGFVMFRAVDRFQRECIEAMKEINELLRRIKEGRDDG